MELTIKRVRVRHKQKQKPNDGESSSNNKNNNNNSKGEYEYNDNNNSTNQTVPFANKIVVRGLPPSLPESVFLATATAAATANNNSEDDDINPFVWQRFCQGNSSKSNPAAKHPRLSRAYLAFASSDRLVSFSRAYNGWLFKEEKSGLEYRASVELAPFQKIPKLKAKVDYRANTIDTDPEYMEFLDSLNKDPAAIADPGTSSPPTATPVATGISAATTPPQPSAPQFDPKSTPLLDDLRAKKAAIREAAERKKETAAAAKAKQVEALLAGTRNATSGVSTESKRSRKKQRQPERPVAVSGSIPSSAFAVVGDFSSSNAENNVTAGLVEGASAGNPGKRGGKRAAAVKSAASLVFGEPGELTTVSDGKKKRERKPRKRESRENPISSSVTTPVMSAFAVQPTAIQKKQSIGDSLGPQNSNSASISSSLANNSISVSGEGGGVFEDIAFSTPISLVGQQNVSQPVQYQQQQLQQQQQQQGGQHQKPQQRQIQQNSRKNQQQQFSETQQPPQPQQFSGSGGGRGGINGGKRGGRSGGGRNSNNQSTTDTGTSHIQWQSELQAFNKFKNNNNNNDNNSDSNNLQQEKKSAKPAARRTLQKQQQQFLQWQPEFNGVGGGSHSTTEWQQQPQGYYSNNGIENMVAPVVIPASGQYQQTWQQTEFYSGNQQYNNPYSSGGGNTGGGYGGGFIGYNEYSESEYGQGFTAQHGGYGSGESFLRGVGGGGTGGSRKYVGGSGAAGNRQQQQQQQQ
ncbi:hypothetical protein HK100_011270 [Physocladia obscura]|uniref:UPF3 domain-containing protein n=1 Tax=Physocladia obscura TaxID=109957 RepID=A0AAD5T4F1_9FUNG|nr:hypothetical protein HK100_011270 [Physocladia obscura]